APTAPPTEPPTPTAPLFLEPTARPDAAPPTTAAPTATAVPSASAAPAAATAAPATATPQAALAQQPATDGTRPARLTVEAIGLDKPLVPVGLDSNRYPVVPDHDVGWYIHSARPGAGENIVLWAHVLRFRATPHIPAPFARLKELKAGDRVTLFDTQGIAYRYIVTQQVWATPDQIEYMLPRGREQVTMISCIGEKVILDGSTTDMTHRLITIAEPED
ncbi:MAG TPA: class F sortase, partial [Roseiflexaceae bacterium]|nr:class F sortase [Roseiflexaceae bacterium]